MIERYRAANGIDDAERAWGSGPASERQGVAFEQADNQVTTARTEPGQPHGVERADGLTADL